MNGCDIWSAIKKICLQEDNDRFESEEGDFRPKNVRKPMKVKKRINKMNGMAKVRLKRPVLKRLIMTDIKEELI